MTEPTSDLVKRLDELRLKAFHSNAPHDLYEYHNALSSAFQNRELVPAARIRALEAEVGELTKQRDGAIANLKEANADVLEAGEDLKEAIQRAEDADRRVAEEREQCAKIAEGIERVFVSGPIRGYTDPHNPTAASIASAIRSRSNGAEPEFLSAAVKNDGVTARSQGASPISAFGSDSADALSDEDALPKLCSFCGGTGTFDDPARGDDRHIECTWCNGTGDAPRAHRSPSAVSEDVEAILGKPKSVEEMLPRTMATLAAMREESSIAPEALSEGGE